MLTPTPGFQPRRLLGCRYRRPPTAGPPCGHPEGQPACLQLPRATSPHPVSPRWWHRHRELRLQRGTCGAGPARASGGCGRRSHERGSRLRNPPRALRLPGGFSPSRSRSLPKAFVFCRIPAGQSHLLESEDLPSWGMMCERGSRSHRKIL